MASSSELFQQMRDEYIAKKGEINQSSWDNDSDWDSEANSYADTSSLQMQAVARIGLEVQRLENEQNAQNDLQILRALAL